MLELLTTLLENGAAFRFRATGYSMTPTIRDQDIVVISPLKHLPPRKGEIVAFRHPGNQQLTIHRFIGSRGSLALCRGDNRDIADDPVPLAEIIGVITAIQRNGKRRIRPDRFSLPTISRCYCLLDLYLKRFRRLIKTTVKGDE